MPIRTHSGLMFNISVLREYKASAAVLCAVKI
jgi:hypothetical protein